VCVDAKLENAEETAKQIAQEGGEALVFAADVTRKAECEAMVQAALDRWSAVDILHNNVGIESRRTLFEVTEEEWDQVMAVDLKSMLLATQAAAPPWSSAAEAPSCACPPSRPCAATAAPPTRRPRRA
jgi:NAD(P)-dependent dehydrogenase (short-subunit alcohol dehydrogenase family)